MKTTGLWRRYGWVIGYLVMGLWVAFSLMFPGGLWMPFDEDLFPLQESLAVSPASPGLIRLHVIANSDSPEDQALKYRVRDAIVAEMAPKLNQSSELEESRQLIQSNLNILEEISWETVSQEGYAYPVKAEIGYFDFPTRSYGELTLPAGRYEAVRVVIGNGEGANWWCVLFPPLCFVNVSTGLAATPEAVAVSTKGMETESGTSGFLETDKITTLSTATSLEMKAEIQTGEMTSPKIRYKVWDWWKTIWDKR